MSHMCNTTFQEKEQQHTAEETLQEQMKSFEREQMEVINKEKVQSLITEYLL